jgi:energy-coupling factor transport system permease protein
VARAARDLHPGAWWTWALGLAVAASLTTNPWLLLLVVAVAGFVVALRRADHTWSLSFRLYLLLGVAIVAVRVLFRIVFGGGYGHVVLDLPRVPLPDWTNGFVLLGPVTREALLAGAYDGLRLAAIVICVGAANALANPKRLLKAMPPALHEIGTAVVVAVAVLPQLADSLLRVRAARRLREAPPGRLGRLRSLVVPVLEDALERSMSLAAGMDVRGYGRVGALSRGRRRLTGALMLLGLVGICVGTYAVLDRTAPRWLAGPMLAAGVVLAAGGFASAGRRVRRTRYRPDRWRPAEVAVALSGVAVAVGVRGLDVLTRQPDVTALPPVTAAALGAVLLGVVPALVAPPPVLSAAPRTSEVAA